MARPRKLTPLKERDVYEQRKRGVSLTEIAYKNGISVKTVERIYKRIDAEEREVKNNG